MGLGHHKYRVYKVIMNKMFMLKEHKPWERLHKHDDL